MNAYGRPYPEPVLARPPMAIDAPKRADLILLSAAADSYVHQIFSSRSDVSHC